jgi:hypothetical protein
MLCFIPSDEHVAVDVANGGSERARARDAAVGAARRWARSRQRNVGYWTSQRRREVIEEFFG